MIGRIPVTEVSPVVSGGSWPARAVLGERLPVTATVFRDGHDLVGASVALIGPNRRRRPLVGMQAVGPDRPDVYAAEVVLDAEGMWTFAVEGWADPIGTWHHGIEAKLGAGQDVHLELEEGARLFERLAESVPAERRAIVADVVAQLRDTEQPQEARVELAFSGVVTELLEMYPLRDLVTSSPRYRIWVDRVRATFSSWYEFFPRSEGAHVDPETGQWVSGTFADAAKRLPAIAANGFDVVYLPPIHPVGRSFRKGPNNTLHAGPDDPGSPWAIGSAEGGHDAVHPDLGTLEDFDAFVADTRAQGMEVALDLALQCSPDHPWAKEHPEWFTHRPDGSIAYAENPPKKYQDIYPINFDNDPEGLRAEVLRIVRHWTAHGVRIFRVDNPHTKPVEFWEWLIDQVKSTEPDVLFLAEAFTRPPMLHALAKVGFTQSYTYFTWRTTKQELADYAMELSTSPSADYLRPNFFVNTPDILHASLQYGGPAMFAVRAVLAATLSPSWGVYAGFELFEHQAVRPGSEEYLDSEKYSYRPRDWDAADREGRSLNPYLRLLNAWRREHPALQRLRGLHIHATDSDHVLAYSKMLGEDRVIVVVNLDSHGTREATVSLDLAALGLPPGERFVVHDAATGDIFDWGEHNYVRLDPWRNVAHLLTVIRPEETA
jgi:starch synthase (maltosyl-transferring)